MDVEPCWYANWAINIATNIACLTNNLVDVKVMWQVFCYILEHFWLLGCSCGFLATLSFWPDLLMTLKRLDGEDRGSDRITCVLTLDKTPSVDWRALPILDEKVAGWVLLMCYLVPKYFCCANDDDGLRNLENNTATYLLPPFWNLCHLFSWKVWPSKTGEHLLLVLCCDLSLLPLGKAP